MCLAMGLDCPVKIWEPGECFELGNDLVGVMLLEGHFVTGRMMDCRAQGQRTGIRVRRGRQV